jgi:putative oxygen-independent coproporphyrinogen III oxidase
MKIASLYIHYPFCISKCPYCDFNSFANLNINEGLLLDAYIKEINSYYSLLPDYKIHTIFFGGGTPSLMSPCFLEKILDEVHKLWKLDKNVEISLEANPSTVETNKFQTFKHLGINRLSLGIQALNDKDLKFLGRKHNAEEGINAIRIARKIFKDKYSIDLIYGRPNQTLFDWENELERAIALSPYHLSLYQLTIESGTVFYAKKINEIKEKLSRDLYFLTGEITKKHGIPLYEVSNYAKKGYECKHNMNYWKSGEWIGIGAGAHGRILNPNTKNQSNYKTRIAIENIKNPNLWSKKVFDSNFGYEIQYDLSEQEFIKEFLLMGLRLKNGVTDKDLNKYIKDKNISDIINNENCIILKKQNFIELLKKRIKVTNKGFILLNQIIDNIIV